MKTLTLADTKRLEAIARSNDGAARRAVIERFAPKALERQEGWSWQESDRFSPVTLDVLGKGAKVRPLLQITCVDYEAAKGSSKRRTYRHEFEAPYPLLVEETVGEDGRGSRDIPRPRGPQFRLGDLLAVYDDEGKRRVRFKRGTVVLVGDPKSGSMQIVRRGAARRALRPLFIARAGSKYEITDRGIVG